MLPINFNPFPKLNTERLNLRPLTMLDAPEVFALRSDDEHMRFIGKPPMRTIEDAEAHIKKVLEACANNEMIDWAITFKNSDTLIGIIGFYRVAKEHHRSEVGYMLHKKYWRQGIMHEALQSVVEFGFNKIGFHQLEAIIDKDNVASEKLLLKNKFAKEAHFRENYFFEGRFLDSVHYARLNPAH